MNYPDFKQPPFNTTLLGVVRGVLDYYGIQLTDAMLFGGSGHAFLMNIHPELCPSGPYCWNVKGFITLVRNFGLEMQDYGFFSPGSSTAERNAVENVLKEKLTSGIPCSLVNMENQLITGFDDTGFDTAQPWGPDCGGFPPARLTYGTWAELGNEIHISFFSFNKIEPANEKKIITDSLRYAIDLYDHSENHTGKPYGVGAQAWRNWIHAVNTGHGSEHGSWWNAQVWSECRDRASEYFTEIGAQYPSVVSLCNGLAKDYNEIAEAIEKAGDKAKTGDEKLPIIESAATIEAGCIEKIGKLIRELDSQ